MKAAGRAGRVERHVTDLAGLAVRARQQPAADDQAAADPDVTGDVDEIVGPGVQAAPELRQRGEVGVVADRHGHPRQAQGIAERGRQREVRPVQVRSGDDGLRRAVDGARDACDDGDDRRA
jgi:hypothetical protein